MRVLYHHVVIIIGVERQEFEVAVGKSREERGATMTGERQGKILLLPVAFLTFREAISSYNINTRKRRYVPRGRRENEKHEMHAK